MIFNTDQITLEQRKYIQLRDNILADPELIHSNRYDPIKDLTPLALTMVFSEDYEKTPHLPKLILKIITEISNKVQTEDFRDEVFAIQFKLLIDNFNCFCSDEISSDECESYIENVYEKNNEIIENIPPHQEEIYFDELTVENPIAELNLIDPSEYWRIYVDGDKQRNPNEQGWLGYEKREIGCIAAMHNAFLDMLQNWRQPLTTDQIIRIHDIALSSVKSGSDKVTQGLRDSGTSTGFKYFSLDRVLSTSLSDENSKYGSKLKLMHGVAKRFFIRKIDLSFFTQRLEEYENNLNKAGNSNEKKLHAIVEFGYDMLKWHPFCDGNSRTFITIILNKELMRNGFSPCILNDPLIFEGYVGANALMHAVQEGIQNFKKLKTDREIVNLPKELTTTELSKSASPPNLSLFPAQDRSLRMR